MPLGASGVEVGTGYVSIVPSGRDFGNRLQSEIAGPSSAAGVTAGQQVGRGMTSTVGSTARSLASSVGGVFAVAGAAHFLSGAIQEAREAAEVGRLTEAVITSTGGAAGITAGQVDNLASRLSLLAGVDDDVIQSGENVLLTFTNVRNAAGEGNDVFDQATETALNMSAALGTDLQGSILQVGKALNDPIQGIGALRRVGVQLTDDQEALVQSFVDSGDIMSAQKVILDELAREFGGAAEAAADPAARAEVAMGNLKETMGTALLPLITAAAQAFTSFAPTLEAIVTGFTGLPGPLQASVVGLAGLGVLAGPIGKVVSGLGGMAKALGIVSKLLLANPWVLVAVAAVAAVVLIIKNWDKIKAFFSKLWAWVKNAAAKAWAAVSGLVTSAWASIFRTVSGAAAKVVGAVTGAWAKVTGATSAAWNAITGTLSAAWSAITGAVSTGIETVVGFVTALPGRFIGALVSLGGQLVGLFSSAFNAVLGTVTSIGGEILSFVAGIPGSILRALGNLASILYNAGRDIISGLLSGLRSAVGAVWDFVSGIAEGIVSTITGALGISSPSRVMMGIGVNIGEGLAIGITRSGAGVQSAMGEILPQIDPPTWTASSTGLGAAGGSLSGGLGGTLIVQGPLVHHSGPLTVRDDRDITDISRRFNRDVARAQRAQGRAVTPLP